eukprot:scaffold39007_cov58-Phaeocystis_antarctica.AAC.5
MGSPEKSAVAPTAPARGRPLPPRPLPAPPSAPPSRPGLLCGLAGNAPAPANAFGGESLRPREGRGSEGRTGGEQLFGERAAAMWLGEPAPSGEPAWRGTPGDSVVGGSGGGGDARHRRWRRARRTVSLLQSRRRAVRHEHFATVAAAAAGPCAGRQAGRHAGRRCGAAAAEPAAQPAAQPARAPLSCAELRRGARASWREIVSWAELRHRAHSWAGLAAQPARARARLRAGAQERACAGAAEVGGRDDAGRRPVRDDARQRRHSWGSF